MHRPDELGKPLTKTIQPPGAAHPPTKYAIHNKVYSVDVGELDPLQKERVSPILAHHGLQPVLCHEGTEPLPLLGRVNKETNVNIGTLVA